MVDQDSYVGFVGVQGRKSPTHQPSKPSKPDLPPPAPNMKIRQRTFSLTKETKGFGGVRPPKPDLPPPPFQPEGSTRSTPRVPLKLSTKHELNTNHPRSRSPSPKVSIYAMVYAHCNATL